MSVRVSWAEFDTLAAPMSVQIGWAEFDARASQFKVQVAWAEFDTLAAGKQAGPVPVYEPGGGVARYHSSSNQKYSIPVDVIETEEEEIILAILMEIASHVV